jgi:hypothetical protein
MPLATINNKKFYKIDTRAQSYQAFYGRNLRIFVISKSVYKHFQPSVMFAGKVVRSGWKGLPGTNTIAYYDNP